jgi:hypothetical protein
MASEESLIGEIEKKDAEISVRMIGGDLVVTRGSDPPVTSKVFAGKLVANLLIQYGLAVKEGDTYYYSRLIGIVLMRKIGDETETPADGARHVVKYIYTLQELYKEKGAQQYKAFLEARTLVMQFFQLFRERVTRVLARVRNLAVTEAMKDIADLASNKKVKSSYTSIMKALYTEAGFTGEIKPTDEWKKGMANTVVLRNAARAASMVGGERNYSPKASFPDKEQGSDHITLP